MRTPEMSDGAECSSGGAAASTSTITVTVKSDSTGSRKAPVPPKFLTYCAAA
jgi:hypothetical protein